MFRCRPSKAAQHAGRLWGQQRTIESELPPHAANRYRYSLCEAPHQTLQVVRWRRTLSGNQSCRWEVVALEISFRCKENRLSFGVYSDVSLKAARGKRDAARQQLAAGVDPSEARKAAKVAQAGAATFEAIAREWYLKFSPGWAPSHGDRILRRLENNLFPWLDKRPIAEIRAPELLTVLRRIESRGAQVTAHRAKQNCGQIFRYAVRRVGPSAIRQATFMALCRRRRKSTMPPSPSQTELAHCSAR